MTLLQRLVHKPRTFAARGWIFQIHLYVGLLVALYAILIGVTGSAVVFHPAMRDYRDRAMMTVAGPGSRLPADRILESIRASYPGTPVSTMYLPETENGTFRVSVRKSGILHQVYVDPFSAQIVGELPPKEDFLRWLQRLHFDLLGGPTGRIVNGVFGLLVVLLTVTGLVIWWPGRAFWGRAINVNWRARWKRVNYDLHSAVGFYALLFCLLISLTGAYYAWPEEIRSFISRFSPIHHRDPAPKVMFASSEPSGELVSIDRLIGTAAGLVPDANVLRVSFAAEEARAVRVVLSKHGDQDYPNVSSVFFDPYTAEVMRIDRADDRSVGDAIVAWIPALHFGTFGGTPVRILWVLLGLTPALLGVSGALMWWNRVAVKRVSKWRHAGKLRPAPVAEVLDA